MPIEDCKLQIDRRRAAGRGITLVELLVAISILVILMAVASQMLNFSVEDRRTREAARAINVYLSSARNRAMETGRPCGVMLKGLAGRPLCVVGLQQVEVPPPYAGDTLDSRAQVEVSGNTGQATLTGADSLTALVQNDDLVQFNYQGPMYTITGVAAGQLSLQINLPPGQMLPWPTSQPVPYQIIRRPRKAAATPLQLPAGAVIDREASGTDEIEQPSGHLHTMAENPGEPLCIMFLPNGSLERIYHGGQWHLGVKPVYLLVGKQERVPAEAGGPSPAEDGLYNWQDTRNFWVTLNPQTGLVTTTEVAAVDPSITDPDQGIPLARAIAREGQSMGGR